MCGEHVPERAGYFQRLDGRWVVRCQKCVGKGNNPERSAMRFKQMPSPFASQGDALWGAVVRERYTFCIVYTCGLGYSATWKDGWRPDPHQANKIAEDVATFAEAERACHEHEKRLRPN